MSVRHLCLEKASFEILRDAHELIRAFERTPFHQFLTVAERAGLGDVVSAAGAVSDINAVQVLQFIARTRLMKSSSALGLGKFISIHFFDLSH